MSALQNCKKKKYIYHCGLIVSTVNDQKKKTWLFFAGLEKRVRVKLLLMERNHIHLELWKWLKQWVSHQFVLFYGSHIHQIESDLLFITAETEGHLSTFLQSVYSTGLDPLHQPNVVFFLPVAVTKWTVTGQALASSVATTSIILTDWLHNKYSN